MSRGSSSAPPQSWPKHGPVPLTRCPECTRMEPLVRLTCKKMDTGNYGREFVKCESRPQPGKILKQCTYFCWLDAYIEKLQFEGVDLRAGAVVGLDAGRAGAEQAGGADALHEVAAELKKLNQKMRQLVELKKQRSIISGAFYVCFVLLGLSYVVLKAYK